MTTNKKIVLAYSGGLDTSYCIPYLREKKGFEVITVTVDTGGFSPAELTEIEDRANDLGVLEHHTVDGRSRVFDNYVSYLIKGNVLRGGVYPLAVAAERVVQAEMIAEVVREIGADAVAHGSTGAGNDQVRFDIAFSVLLPGIEVLTPIRDEKLSRDEEYDFLVERGVNINKTLREYSSNSGLWGATIGGGETHDPWKSISESVYEQAVDTPKADAEETVVVSYEKGVPVALDNRPVGGVELIEQLGEKCRAHRVGLGIHIGDTVLGIKGRIAFEAGVAQVLIHAHRELEKIVLTGWQRFWKDHVAEFYGKLIHEGNAFDPVLRDIEALIDSSQERLTGDARICLRDGNYVVEGVESPYNVMQAAAGVYGEMPKLWTGEDVRGFSTITSVPSRLYRQAGSERQD